MLHANTERFLLDPVRYFTGSYAEFAVFGGPCVYFHDACLRACADEWLSTHHVQLLYATLTAWGMHRMGDPTVTRTKLTDWDVFSTSILDQRAALEPFRKYRMLDMPEAGYAEAVGALNDVYRRLKLSISEATIVVNSKSLFHLFPEFIVPIDRHYTVRFFTKPPEKWRDRKGKFQPIFLPATLEEQSDLFCELLVAMKQLAGRIDPTLFETERRNHRVTAPKALDNALVNYVKIVAKQPAAVAAHAS